MTSLHTASPVPSSVAMQTLSAESLPPHGLPSWTDIAAALRLVRPHVQPSPLLSWPLLNDRTGCEVLVKHENHNPTGAFKVRGGIVYLTRLLAEQPDLPGVITATRGNHGQSVARAAQALGLRCVIVVPTCNSPEKNALMRALGAELVVEGRDVQESSEIADRMARDSGLHKIPSFHPWLVAGVATYGLELFEAAPDLDAVLVPVGMGSGVCGVLAARDALGVKAQVYGVVADGAPAYGLSWQEKRVVCSDRADTIADGVACRSPVPQVVSALVQRSAGVLSVSDDEIAAAMRHYFTDTHNVAEGAGAVPLAALLRHADQFRGKKVGLILSGGNADSSLFHQVLQGQSIDGFRCYSDWMPVI